MKYLNLLTSITLLLSLASFSQTRILDNISYKITSTSPNTVEIIDNTNTGAIIIPSTVELDGVAYSVTSIGRFAFQNNKITSVQIPNTVTFIGNVAFQSNKLTKVTIPDSVEFIGLNAFRDNDLSSVSLGKNVSSIGYSAFSNNWITTLTIPAGVTYIEEDAFDNNPLSTVVAMGSSPAKVVLDSFAKSDGINLVIPTGASKAYADAGWKGFKSVLESNSLDTEDFVLTGSDVQMILTD